MQIHISDTISAWIHISDTINASFWLHCILVSCPEKLL